MVPCLGLLARPKSPTQEPPPSPFWGSSFAGEEIRTMVWVSFSLQIYSTFEFWRFKFSVVWVLVWVSSFYGNGGGSRTVTKKRGTVNPSDQLLHFGIVALPANNPPPIPFCCRLSKERSWKNLKGTLRKGTGMILIFKWDVNYVERKQKGGFIKGRLWLANVPLFRFLVPGSVRRNHPFGNHPFVNPWLSTLCSYKIEVSISSHCYGTDRFFL